jgi:hypothetical protein
LEPPAPKEIANPLDSAYTSSAILRELERLEYGPEESARVLVDIIRGEGPGSTKTAAIKLLHNLTDVAVQETVKTDGTHVRTMKGVIGRMRHE